MSYIFSYKQSKTSSVRIQTLRILRQQIMNCAINFKFNPKKRENMTMSGHGTILTIASWMVIAIVLMGSEN